MAFPVRPVDQATLAEVLALLELRISLETEAAALAAKRRSDAQLARMEALLETIARAARTAAATPPTPTSSSTCASPKPPATTTSPT